MRYLMIIVLAVALAIAPAAKIPAAAADSLVNMNVYNAEARDVLFALAGVGGVNMLIDDSVAGTVTIQLKDVPFETALSLVTKLKGLTYHRQGDVIVIADSRRLAHSFGGIYFFRLSYADAETIVPQLLLLFPEKDQGVGATKTTETQTDTLSAQNRTGNRTAGAVDAAAAQREASVTTNVRNSETIRFRVDAPTNTIIFKGTPSEAEQIAQVLSRLDVPYKQITLEAQVVSLTKESSKNLGVEWSWEDTPQTESGVNKGSITYGRNPDGQPYRFYFQARINALVSSGNAKILARPKITTLNGQPAKILIGERVPLLVEKVSSGIITTSIDYVDTGIKLVFTPNINTDSSITAVVNTEVSSPALVPEMKAYKITTREAETVVRMQDGETMVIGGLIGVVDSQTRKAIPLLSSLPLLGELFKSKTSAKTDTEVVIFLTATIVE